jgi:hypothetical protein
VKKTLFIVALVAMLVFAMAGTALAAGINHSGQDQVGARGTVPTLEPGKSQAMIYNAWDTSLGSNATDGNSPHGNYTTTTVKCVVCHAVHYAAPLTPAGSAPGTYTVASGNQQADTLLRMKASDACVFCHATAGFSVNGRPVYNGAGSSIVGPGNTGGGTNAGHIIGTNCTYCHTNVHGANADHTVAALDGFLLKLMTATNVQGTGATTNSMIDAITAIDHNAQNQGFAAGAALNGTIGQYATVNNHALYGEQAVGIFCAECHLGSYAQAAPGAAANVLQDVPGSPVAYTGHRIAASVTTNWNAAGDISSGLVQNQQVAWAPAANCKSCHDALDNYNNAAFPHAWGKSGVNATKMWLLSAADAGAAAVSVGAPASNPYNTTKVQLSDGVCLKCHVASGGTSGVGITF